MKCWGNNFDGQTEAPVGMFVEVSSHFSHSCARNDQDEVVCWGGFNVNGELDADNTQAPYISVDVGFHLMRGHARRLSGLLG